MAAIKTRAPKTVDDYMRLPEGTLAELIEGEILMSPSPREKHQRALLILSRLLSEFVERRRLGRIYIAPFDVHLPSGDIVQPDVIFVSTPNLGIIRDWIYGVPDLLIEVVSPEGTERDRIIKRALYARNGVKEYWIVDAQARTVEVLALSGDRYAPQGFFEEGDALSSTLLPDFGLPVADLFA